MAVPILLPYVLGDDVVRGELSGTAPAPSVSADGTVRADGPLAATAPLPVVAGEATATASGTIAITAPAPSVVALPGSVTATGDLDVTAPAPTFAGAATLTVDGPLASTAPSPTVDIDGGAVARGTLTAESPLPTTDVGGTVTAAGVTTYAAPVPVVDIDATAVIEGTFTATTLLPTFGGPATVTARGTLAAEAPLPTYGFVLGAESAGNLAASAPIPTVLLTDAGRSYDFPVYQIEVDWNNDGDWSDGNEDVTDDVAGLAGVAIQYGRDTAKALSPTAGGSAGMELDNTSEKYTPANTASPLYGLLLPGRPVRMRVGIGPSTYSLFYGHTDDSPLDPDITEKSVELSMLDGLAKLRGQDISTSLYRGIRTGEAIGYVLDAVGWPADMRDLDDGATVLPWWWCSEIDAYEALIDLVNSEGPPALLSVGSEGEVVYRDRHHRLIGSASRDVQAYWPARDLAEGSKVGLSWSNVINHVSFEVVERSADGELTQVWHTEDVTSFVAGQSRVFRVAAAEPFIGALTPEADVDYLVLSGIVSVTLSRTSGQHATITVTADLSGPATIMGMALRAYSVPVRRTRVVQAEDTTSIAKYGRRSWPGEAGFAGRHDANAQAQLIIDGHADPLPVLTARFVSTDASELAQQVARDLSDRIEVTDHVALGGQWYIDAISHRFDGRVGHETVFTCEQVRLVDPDVFTLGSATDGVIGTSKLGRTAPVTPLDALILGSAENGVIGTNRLGF